MKLPFNVIIGPLLKPNLENTSMFCQHPTFAYSIIYTYFYGTLGFFISANHLRKHLGESPFGSDTFIWSSSEFDHNYMLLHDLKIIATSMGIVQYACLLIGCLTQNPALFLPHLAGQLVVVSVKLVNALLLLTPMNTKSLSKLRHRVPAIILLTFNWLQEFCVFRQYMCICDL